MAVYRTNSDAARFRCCSPRGEGCACAHPRCSVIVKDGQTYAESTITVHTGEPVCLECAAALWAPEPEEIPVLLDAQEDRLIATLTAMLNSED